MQLTPSRIAAEVEYFSEREQAARDEAADAAYERRELAAAQVTFDDVLEQMAALPDSIKTQMMDLFDGRKQGDRRHFEWKLVALFVAGLETATDLRVAQGD